MDRCADRQGRSSDTMVGTGVTAGQEEVAGSEITGESVNSRETKQGRECRVGRVD